MVSDFWLVVRWWGVLFLVGAAAFPLTKKLFGNVLTGSDPVKKQGQTLTAGWWDGGYFFSKAVGMAGVSWLVYALGTVRMMPFTVVSIGVALGVVFVGGILLGYQGTSIRYLGFKSLIPNTKYQSPWNKASFTQFAVILVEELFFLTALVFWSWIKGHEPSIRGLEKFMDFGFMQSILNSQYFPPADMWYPPLPINYYYFGHLVTAVLTKLSGIDLAYTFNLMLATLFALTLTMSFSVGYQLSAISCQPLKAESWKLKSLFSGLLTAFLVTLAGNMQTIYAFTRGYAGDDVQPFWQLLWPLRDLWQRLPEGMQTYWYANATRFIPFSIHEFPSYSFVVSDVHGHVLSIPFVLLAIGMLIQLSAVSYQLSARLIAVSWKLMAIFYGFLVGALLMTNALDGPIYFALLVAVLGISMRQRVSASMQNRWKELVTMVGVVVLAASITSLPFLSHFKSFVSGLAVNCPPAFLANTKIGPLLFEGVEKCQRSPLWMLWILWGFFVYCGAGLLVSMRQRVSASVRVNKTERILIVFFIFSLALIIFPEFFYFKDIYPAHFRSNTMFKLGYQAFILFSIVSAYTIVSMSLRAKRSNLSNHEIATPRKAGLAMTAGFIVFLIPQLFLVSIFPIFSVRSYFNGLKKYEGLYGLNWMQKEYPDDWAGIEWMNKIAISRQSSAISQAESRKLKAESSSALVEADGDSYTDYARFSAFTGIPTIIGWGVHEWLWRGGYDAVAPRRTDVQQIYESTDPEATRTILTRFGVRYIIVGTLERQKYPNLAEWKFRQLGKIAFQQGSTTIYIIE